MKVILLLILLLTRINFNNKKKYYKIKIYKIITNFKSNKNINLIINLLNLLKMILQV